MPYANHSCFQSKNFLSVAKTQYHNADKVTGRSDYMGTKHGVAVHVFEICGRVDRKFNV